VWKEERYRVWLVNLELRHPFERHKHIREDNIKMDLKGLERNGPDWINLAQDTTDCRAFVNTIIKMWEI
jgi:hypothetical protein